MAPLTTANVTSEARSVGIGDLYRNFHSVRIVSCVSPFGGEAGELGQLLRPAQRLDIPVQNLVGGGPLGTLPLDFNFIWIVRRWRAALLRKTRDDLGAIENTAMA